MRDILIIPTFNRPEMLSICLWSIVHTGDIGKFDMRVVIDDHVDRRYDPDIFLALDAIEYFRSDIILRKPHNCYGNSRNIMEAYKEAYATDARLVFMVEDDIVASPDFFKWCYTVHADERIDCAVATRPEREGCEIRNWEGRYVNHDFASGAVCWKRASLAKVVPHACGSFYNRITDYCDEHFPDSPLRGFTGEQDGLIRRISQSKKLNVAWPWYPRAHHVGIYGYHDLIRPRGTYEERLAYLRDAIKNQSEMNKWRNDCQAVKP